MVVSGFKTEVKNLGIRIRKIRKSRKLTLQQLGDLTGIGKSNLSRYENAKAPNIEYLTIFTIAKALDVSVSELTNYEGPIPGGKKNVS
jgi:XRE family transcriptional regulator, fatty acid utilization regulator